MSARFKVGDLVVRNPEARVESGWPYDDEVCRVVGYYPNQNGIIVVPVNSPPNKRLHDCGWVAERFAPATTPAPRAARRNDPPTSKVAALAMIDFVEGPITALRTALAEQPAEREPVRGEWQGYTWNPYAVSQPKAEPLTDEEIDNTIRKQVDDLLDHIYEYGTAAEGIDYRVRAIARAIERAHGIGDHE